MRPHLIRGPRQDGFDPASPAQPDEAARLHSVAVGRRRVESPELWVGVQLPATASGAPSASAAPQSSAQPESSHTRLEELATRAQRFTPRVSLVPPDGVLLEVKG